MLRPIPLSMKTNHRIALYQEIASTQICLDAFDAIRIAPYKDAVTMAQDKSINAIKSLIKAQDDLHFADIELANAMQMQLNEHLRLLKTKERIKC